MNFAYDSATDILTIEGIRYAGELFRGMGVRGFAPGAVLQIVERLDGTITLKRLVSLEGLGE